MTDAIGSALHTSFNARMTRLGVSFGKFVSLADVLDAWPSNPQGFHFKCQNLESLRAAVANNPHFGREQQFFEMFEKLAPPSCAFREVGNQDSLHVIFRFGQPSVIHLDSISIAQARDRRTGRVIYVDDLGVMIDHHRVDFKHQKCLFYCK